VALSKIDTAAIATDAIEAAQLKSNAIAVGDLPTGTVLKVENSYTQSTVSVANSGTGRTYVDLRSITYTPVASGNKLYIFATAGHNSYTSHSDRAGFGIVINVDGTRYDYGNYNWYEGTSRKYPTYAPDEMIHYGGVTTGSSNMTIKMEGYAYNESVGTVTPQWYGRGLTVMEFAA